MRSSFRGGRELSWNGLTSSPRSVEANKWRSFFVEAGWSSPTSSTPPTRASGSEAGLRQRTGSVCAPIHRFVRDEFRQLPNKNAQKRETPELSAQVVSTSSHGRFYFSHGPKRLRVRRVRSRRAVESVCGQDVNLSLSQPIKYIPLTVHKAPELTTLRPSEVCAIWYKSSQRIDVQQTGTITAGGMYLYRELLCTATTPI